MNMQEWIKKEKDRLVEQGQRIFGLLKKKCMENKTDVMIYVGFTVITSFICILFAEISLGKGFREWYYNWKSDRIISKGIEHSTETAGTETYGSFITYYRYSSFGASNPGEIDAEAPMVALTFDDGPNPEYTGRILKVLEENYSHATFFVVGTNAEQYPETLQAIAVSGNELGNHTFSHADLTQITDAEVEEEIEKVDRAVKKATGEETVMVRPPYGAYDDEVLQQLDVPVVLWDMDTEDWDSRNAQVIAEMVLANVSDGDIILMHDIYESTAEAVEILVPRLKEMGYQVVSVGEMAQYKGKTLELGKAYGGIKQSQE